jgi:hypothetical protein
MISTIFQPIKLIKKYYINTYTIDVCDYHNELIKNLDKNKQKYIDSPFIARIKNDYNKLIYDLDKIKKRYTELNIKLNFNNSLTTEEYDKLPNVIKFIAGDRPLLWMPSTGDSKEYDEMSELLDNILDSKLSYKEYQEKIINLHEDYYQKYKNESNRILIYGIYKIYYNEYLDFRQLKSDIENGELSYEQYQKKIIEEKRKIYDF